MKGGESRKGVEREYTGKVYTFSYSYVIILMLNDYYYVMRHGKSDL